jgi:hypothetical protein
MVGITEIAVKKENCKIVRISFGHRSSTEKAVAGNSTHPFLTTALSWYFDVREAGSRE